MNILDEFFLHCSNGEIKNVKQILQNKNFDIDIKNNNGWTGLIIACFNCHFDLAVFFISKGADVNAVNNNGTSVFMYAKTSLLSNFNKTNMLDLLLNKGAQINHLDIFGKSVLDYVNDSKNEELSKWLISKGAKTSSELNHYKSHKKIE